MDPQFEQKCPSLVGMLNLAPDAITEIDTILKDQPSGLMALRLNRIVALLYEISLCHDQIRKHLAEQGGGESSERGMGRREAEALAAQLAGNR